MEKETGKNGKKSDQPNNYLKYSGIAFQMIATILLGAWGGIALDDYFKVESHMFTVVLMLVSVIASMYLVIRGLMK
ncbi:MAG TPA: AtpZ/AtpI family protein [Cytophagaceae bacterium]|nr:AtpZ/AtpI family protein [Cytophagaceae bacterium]